MPQLAVNKDARRTLHILETLEAGVVLTGAEVKSVKRGSVDLRGSYAMLRAETPVLVNCHIAPYQHAQTQGDPRRDRTLLLKKAEITTLIGKLAGGLTLVPLSVYTHRGLVKVELGLGRGKKLHDRRADIKKRETKRAIERALRKKDR